MSVEGCYSEAAQSLQTSIALISSGNRALDLAKQTQWSRFCLLPYVVFDQSLVTCLGLWASKTVIGVRLMESG